MAYDSRPTEELRRMASETEALLRDLQAELTRRQQAEQHLAIEHLEEHLAHAKLSLSSLRDFFHMLMGELHDAAPTPKDKP